MSKKKSENNQEKSNFWRYIVGFGAFAIAFFLEKELEHSSGRGDLFYVILMIVLYIVALVALVPIIFRGVPEAIMGKQAKGKNPSGGSFSDEALNCFENHPCETTYTDSHGRGWDNTFFDD